MADAQVKTGDLHPYGAGLSIITIESDGRGGSAYVKKEDGFWWFLNSYRYDLDGKDKIVIVEEYPVSKDTAYVKKQARRQIAG